MLWFDNMICFRTVLMCPIINGIPKFVQYNNAQKSDVNFSTNGRPFIQRFSLLVTKKYLFLCPKGKQTTLLDVHKHRKNTEKKNLASNRIDFLEIIHYNRNG